MSGKARQLLAWRIISGIAEETVLAVVVLWVLPRMGINVPVWLLVLAMIVMAGYGVFTYRKSRRALLAPPVAGLASLVGEKGRALSALAPSGTVRVSGETWAAESAGGNIEPGGRVVVVSQDRLRLTVRSAGQSDSLETP